MANPIDSNNNSYLHGTCYYNTEPQNIAIPKYPNDIPIPQNNNKKISFKYYFALLCSCFIKNKKNKIK
jgi:hypothetical protein